MAPQGQQSSDTASVPALLIIDVQEDFLPPTGSLAVPSGRSIIPHINTLLSLPFALKVATKDWHPADHISFAPNHPHLAAFDTITMPNPLNAAESLPTTVWPVHCVQGTPGAEFAAELRARLEGRDDGVVTFTKGMRSDLETYSAFYDDFKNPRVIGDEFAALLRASGVTRVFVVGVAADYCVRATALHAVAEGFETFVVEEAVRPVNAEGYAGVKKEMEGKGVKFVGVADVEL